MLASWVSIWSSTGRCGVKYVVAHVKNEELGRDLKETTKKKTRTTGAENQDTDKAEPAHSAASRQGTGQCAAIRGHGALDMSLLCPNFALLAIRYVPAGPLCPVGGTR